MSEDWLHRIVNQAKREQAARKADDVLLEYNAKQRELIQAASPKLWNEVRTMLREKIIAINDHIGSRYFYSSDRKDAPETKTLNVFIESPQGEIEILFVEDDEPNVLNIYKVKYDSSDVELKKNLQRTFHFAVRDKEVCFAVRDEYFSAAQVAEYCLDLLVYPTTPQRTRP